MTEPSSTPPAPARRPEPQPERYVAEHHEPSWREGLKVGTPTLFGIGAWGLVVGIAMVKSGLSVPQALGMTLLVFAGSAQLAALPLIAASAPIWVIFLTAFVVNLRFVIFAALLAPHFAHLPWKRRFLLGYVSGDLTVALFLQKYPSEAPNWGAWQVGSIAGIFLGSTVPTEWGLGFAGTLAIICVMIPLMIGRPALCGVVVAGVVSVLAAGLPYKLGLLLAVLVGMLTAMAVEEGTEKWRNRLGNKNG